MYAQRVLGQQLKYWALIYAFRVRKALGIAR